mmetsp:Transcript_37434/g.99500  ORF Transcript_37434/g.99500 Transcript_37434/m.99500 type:complete len:448 (-) Transcript_37434:175-1518(-)
MLQCLLPTFQTTVCCTSDSQQHHIDEGLADAVVWTDMEVVDEKNDMAKQFGKWNPSDKIVSGRQVKAAPTYSVKGSSLKGCPQVAGPILYLNCGQVIEESTLSLYVNGFEVTAKESGVYLASVWSPFSVVEKCQVAVRRGACSVTLPVLKLTVFSVENSERTYFFATKGLDAFQVRDYWLGEIKLGIERVTLSLFPPHAINVAPVNGIASTRTRIMAGYLLQCVAQDSVRLYYCELHAYKQGHARLAIYENEWCDQWADSVQLTELTVVSSRKGIHCSVLGIDSLRFCARTMEEKDLWLRAISNIKVKLLHEAPDPTSRDLDIFRAAVWERIEMLKDTEAHQERLDPLLPSLPRVLQRSTTLGDNLVPPSRARSTSPARRPVHSAIWLGDSTTDSLFPPPPSIDVDGRSEMLSQKHEKEALVDQGAAVCKVTDVLSKFPKEDTSCNS